MIHCTFKTTFLCWQFLKHMNQTVIRCPTSRFAWVKSRTSPLTSQHPVLPYVVSVNGILDLCALQFGSEPFYFFWTLITSSRSIKQCSFIQVMHHTCHVIQLLHISVQQIIVCLYSVQFAFSISVWITVVKRVLIFVLVMLYGTVSQA